MSGGESHIMYSEEILKNGSEYVRFNQSLYFGATGCEYDSVFSLLITRIQQVKATPIKCLVSGQVN